jgi:hypothetical protein
MTTSCLTLSTVLCVDSCPPVSSFANQFSIRAFAVILQLGKDGHASGKHLRLALWAGSMDSLIVALHKPTTSSAPTKFSGKTCMQPMSCAGTVLEAPQGTPSPKTLR